MEKLYLITNNPFVHKSKISYGLIIHASDTQRWLLVQRRDSIFKMSISHGSYYSSYLICNVKYIPNSELDELVKASLSESAFTNFFREVNSVIIQSTINIGFKKLKECVHIIVAEIKRRKKQNIIIVDTNDWSWIKGKKEKGEETMETLIREMKEETGIELSDHIHTIYRDDKDKIEHKYITPTGCTYINEYYLCVVEKEFEIGKYDDKEIKNLKWMTTEEARDKISNPQTLIDARLRLATVLPSVTGRNPTGS